LFIGYHNDEKLKIDFAATMLGMKNVEQLTEAKLVKEVRHFMELKGSLPCTQYSSQFLTLGQINPVHTSFYF